MKKNKLIKYKIVVCFLLMLLFNKFSSAQKIITLNHSIDEALKNNLMIKSEKLRTMYQQKLTQTYASVLQANLVAEAGQLNSIYRDTKFGIIQSFSFPVVYAQQHKVLNKEFEIASLNAAMKEIELVKNVKQLFYLLVVLRQKEKLLIKADSLYGEFLRKSALRLSVGESNILEKTSAESIQGTIHLQLKNIQQDIEIASLKFQLLLNTNENIFPSEDDLKMSLTSQADSTDINNHLSIKLFQQQIKLAESNVNLERAKLLPDISIGYFNTSIKGNGADNIFYTAANRFNSIQVGVGVPLFFKAQQNRVKSSSIQQQIATNNFQNQYNELKNEWKSAKAIYQNNLQMISYYENTALPNAKLIASIAQQQFSSGEINYLEWVMLMNQSISIQNNYLDAVKSFNESIISIQYLTSK